MAPGVSGPCTEATSCLWSSHTGNCPLGLVLYAIRVMTVDHMLSYSEKSLSQTLNIYAPTPSWPLFLTLWNQPALYQLCTVTMAHFYSWSQTRPSNISPCRRKSFTSQSLVRCHGARGGQHTPSPLGNLESLLGATEWTLMGLYTVYVPYCHHYMCWSSGE